MGQGYLIDTNVVIDFSGNQFDAKGKSFVSEVIDNNPYISVINKIELLGFSIVNREIIEFIDASRLIGLTDDVVNRTIIIRKEQRIKLPDAVIAASALVHDLVLLTRNVNDFKEIDGIQLINPWER